jgi:hypothetical protein
MLNVSLIVILGILLAIEQVAADESEAGDQGTSCCDVDRLRRDVRESRRASVGKCSSLAK